jgi:RES domain-containing protein
LSALWRISRHDDLAGLGGERSDGRWHTAAKGKRIVYLSEHPALALIEVLANLKGNPNLFPDTYRLLRIAVDERLMASAADGSPVPQDWRGDLALTRQIGDEWLARRNSALLKVPSAPSPESVNVLLNPLHPDAKSVRIEWSRWMEYDKRLFHLQQNQR